ncbi:MAG: hypothetical protein U1C19_11785 [Methanobacteriaceae archaeon]|nr:hypothetical protein [Methanobacteriaceae archaeon]
MLKSYQTRVKSCSEEYKYYDKKLRERSYKLDKYIIVLEDKAPFKDFDEIIVISEEDFQKMVQAIKKLKNDKKDLLDQLEYLRNTELSGDGHAGEEDHNTNDMINRLKSSIQRGIK